MNVNKFCDNWQNCTIHKGDVINLHDFNRFRNDPEHFLRREQRDTYSSSSQLSRAISFSRSGNNNSTVFSRTRNLLYRCVHSAYRGNKSSCLFFSESRGRRRRNFKKFIARPSASTTSAVLRESSTPRFPIPPHRGENEISMLFLLLSQLATELANESNRSDTVRRLHFVPKYMRSFLISIWDIIRKICCVRV